MVVFNPVRPFKALRMPGEGNDSTNVVLAPCSAFSAGVIEKTFIFRAIEQNAVTSG